MFVEMIATLATVAGIIGVVSITGGVALPAVVAGIESALAGALGVAGSTAAAAGGAAAAEGLAAAGGLVAAEALDAASIAGTVGAGSAIAEGMAISAPEFLEEAAALTADQMVAAEAAAADLLGGWIDAQIAGESAEGLSPVYTANEEVSNIEEMTEWRRPSPGKDWLKEWVELAIMLRPANFPLSTRSV
jgi:hypothetical protein